MTESKEIFNKWLSGPAVHAHLQIETDDFESERHQFTPESALHYLRQLTQNPNAKLADTNHAFLRHDMDILDKQAGESHNAWKKRVRQEASSFMTARAQKIRRSPHLKNILTGTEVDIVGSNGELSLTDECLQGLDIRIASFHTFTWHAFNLSHCVNVSDFISACQRTVANPQIDILGHPTRLPSRLKEITLNDFLPILETMAKHKVAFEINLLRPLDKFTLEVIKKAKELRVPFVIAFDFHQLNKLASAEDLPVFEGDVKEKKDVEKIFPINRHLHFKIFRLLKQNITILEKQGIEQSQVVNSSNKKFDEWLQSRR